MRPDWGGRQGRASVDLPMDPRIQRLHLDTMQGPISIVCPVLVGRDDLLELGERRLTAGRDGHGFILFLAGEAGIGKTRLLGSIERRAASIGYRTARGGTFPGDLEVAGAVLIDLARSLVRDPGLEAVGRQFNERLASASREADHGDAHRRRRILALDLAELLIGGVADRPTMISLEDLHQADDLTLEVLATVARRVTSVPLAVVATYRSDELFPRVPMRQWRSLMVTKRLVEEVRLGRLSPAGTGTMASALLASGDPLPRAFVDTVHHRTDGIPLHVEELLGLLAAGQIRPEDIALADVPETLEAAILGRFERRSVQARKAAEAGAVIGRSFPIDLLAQTLDQDEERLSRPLAELTDHFVLSETVASGLFGFRHGLICDTIYARIPAGTRRRLHGRVADLAARRADFTDAFLSVHYERAGRTSEAHVTALRAARQAAALSSHQEAMHLYERALRNLPADLPLDAVAAIREAHGMAAAACDANAIAVEALEAARDAWRAAGRPVAAAEILPAIVAARHLLGDGLEERAGRLQEGTAELARLPAGADRDRARGRLLAGLSAAFMLDRRLDESITYGEIAREMAIANGDAATERNASVTVGACLVFAGQMDQGWRHLEDGVRRARDAHLEAEGARAYRMIGSSASVLVEYDRAERWLREGIDYAERTEQWNHRHYMASHLAHVLWATGRWDESERAAEHALADGRGGVTTRITALHALGFVALGRGRLDVARGHLEEALEVGERMRELQRLSPALWGLAEVDLAAGDGSAAIARCERGLAASAAVRDAAYLFPYLVTGTRALLGARDPVGAASWAETVGGHLRHRAVPGTLPAIDHAAGLNALASGSPRAARVHLGAAADAWSVRSRVWEGTWARIDLAEAELRSNRISEAVRIASAARDRGTELGAPIVAERAASVLSRARTGHVTDAAWAPLTAREFEVAQLVATGRTNRAIAGELGLASRTVASHVEHILNKLGAERRSEIASWAALIARDA